MLSVRGNGMRIAVLCLSIVYLCVYLLERGAIVRYLRKTHSKTYLRKLKQGASTCERIFGLYLNRGGVLKARWLSPAIMLTNLDLASFAVAAIAAILTGVDLISRQCFFWVIAVLALKCVVTWLIFFAIGINERINRSAKRRI